MQPPAPIDSTDPAWRLFVALAGARRRLAPNATLRGRIVRAALQGLADGLDSIYTRFAPPHDDPDEPVSAVLAAPAQSVSEPCGSFDGPQSGPVRGRLVLLWGWVFDRASADEPGIHSVGVYLDGLFKGTATCGLVRHDVAEFYGPAAVRSGWQFALDLHGVPTGQHLLQVSALSAISQQETTFRHSIT